MLYLARERRSVIRQDEKAVVLSEMIVERRAVLQPGVGSKAPRVRRRLVGGALRARRLAAVTDDDRRILVPRAQHHAERLELPRLARLDELADLHAGPFTIGRVGIEVLSQKMDAERLVILHRLLD